MSRPPPPLNFIRSFECAARHLSFTRAAKELGYTQAAISTHIRALEKYVGHDLFVRRARSLALTEAGAAFLPTLRQGLAQIDAATEAILSGDPDRNVVLACPVTLAENWIAGMVARFQAAQPGIAVTIHGTVWEGPEDPLADIVVTASHEDEAPPGSCPLWPETLSLVCAPSLGGSIRAPGDLVAHRRILIGGRQEYWSLLAAACGSPELTLPYTDRGVMLRTNGTNTALELAAAGAGVAVALTSVCALYLERGLLLEPLRIRPRSPWKYFAIARSTPRGSAAGRLYRYLLEAAGPSPQATGRPTVSPRARPAGPSGSAAAPPRRGPARSGRRSARGRSAGGSSG
jgi:DNA-binding transcriptional LysR family regulator